jgi:hypothetical protein
MYKKVVVHEEENPLEMKGKIVAKRDAFFETLEALKGNKEQSKIMKSARDIEWKQKMLEEKSA